MITKHRKEYMRNYMKKWSREHAEQLRSKRQQWKKDHKEKINIYQRLWRINNPEKRREYDKRAKLRANHDLTQDNVNELLMKQDNKCAICGEILILSGKSGMHIDHDHTTKVIRGILCSNCNLGLGHFKDDIARLLKAIVYLSI